MYGDIKTRNHRLRNRIFRGGRRGRVTSYFFRGSTAFLMLDVIGFIAWLASGQPLPEKGYFLGKITFELLKVII